MDTSFEPSGQSGKRTGKQSSLPPDIGRSTASSKRYRIELGTGDRAKEVFLKLQKCSLHCGNVRLLQKALNLLEEATVRR